MEKQNGRIQVLHNYLKASGVYNVIDGNECRITYGEHQARAEMLDDKVARVSMGSGVYATPETELALRAVCSHLEGWIYKVGCFGLSDSREIVFYCDRDIVSGNEKASMMMLRLDFTVDGATPHLKKAAEGSLPSEALGLDSRRETRELLLAQLLGDAGLFDGVTVDKE